MLPSQYRLPATELSARGYKTVRAPYFSLKIRVNGLPQGRIGVIIGVAAEKRATRRNFWKRQVKTFFLNYQKKLAGKDIVVIFLKKVQELKKEEFQSEFLKVIKTVL